MGVVEPPGNNAGQPMDAAQTATLVSWLITVIKLQADVVFTADSGKDAEFQPETGPIIDSLFSLVFLGIGLYAAVEQAKSSNYDGWDVANSIVVPIGGCFTWLVTLGDDGLMVELSGEPPCQHAIALEIEGLAI